MLEVLAWCLWLAASIGALLAGNWGWPGRLALEWLGPPRNPPRGSAPPWMDVDIAVMALGLAGIGVAALGLVVLALAECSWRRRQRAGT